MAKAIPDRWLDYRPIGKRIAGTRFIAFKVPLAENINERVEEDLRLAPHSLLLSVPNLGLIMDLTNTNRYYDPQLFTDQNVEHRKLMTPGHQTPPKDIAQRFCKYVKNFLVANADNDKLIGVHCTHGVNRTGYLICYFMITEMNMTPKLAIKSFADARGHKIERGNYVESLGELIAAQGRELMRHHSTGSIGYEKPMHGPREPSRQQSRSSYGSHISGQRPRDERQTESRIENWRSRNQDQNRWQSQSQPQIQPQRHQRYDNNRNNGYDNHWRQQPSQQRWQANNNTGRNESLKRAYNNFAGNGHGQAKRTYRRYDQQEDLGHSRNNNYNNYSRNSSYNNYSRNSTYNNYSRNNNLNRERDSNRSDNHKSFTDRSRNHINRQDRQTTSFYNRITRFDDQE